jgi:polyhydroxyalkanoate synthase
MEEFAELGRRLQRGRELLDRTRDKDVQLATTPKREVFRQDKVVLHHYASTARKKAVATPVLMVHGLIGRYTMADLKEGGSLVRSLLAQGVDLYVVDWGKPTRGDRWLTLEDYIDGYLGDCVDAIREKRKLAAISLFGICEGGVLAACYAARNPGKVKSLTLAITPIDFHAGGRDAPLHLGWARSMSHADVDRLIEANGNLPGELMSSAFSMMTPVGLFDVMDDEKRLLAFLRMEKWLADRPDHPGEAARQWLKDLHQGNQLARGEFRLGGAKVDLGKVAMPVLNVVAEEDPVIPPRSSRALGSLVGTKKYKELALPGGHLEMFLGGKGPAVLARSIAGWLKTNA